MTETKLVDLSDRYFAVGPFCWGKGKTEEEAVKNMRKHWVGKFSKKNYSVLLVEGDPDAFIDGMGSLVRKHDAKVTHIKEAKS